MPVYKYVGPGADDDPDAEPRTQVLTEDQAALFPGQFELVGPTVEERENAELLERISAKVEVDDRDPSDTGVPDPQAKAAPADASPVTGETVTDATPSTTQRTGGTSTTAPRSTTKGV